MAREGTAKGDRVAKSFKDQRDRRIKTISLDAYFFLRFLFAGCSAFAEVFASFSAAMSGSLFSDLGQSEDGERRRFGSLRVAVMVGPKMFRGAVALALEGLLGLRVIGDGSEGLTGEFLKMNRVDLVVLDVDCGGLDLVLGTMPEGCGAILVSRDGEALQLPSWRLTRVVGVVSAEAEVGELLAMVREWMRPRVGGVGGLSQREAEVYRLMGRGLTSREIGEALGISGQTVQVHLRNAAMKCGISGRELRIRAMAEHLGANGAGEV